MLIQNKSRHYVQPDKNLVSCKFGYWFQTLIRVLILIRVCLMRVSGSDPGCESDPGYSLMRVLGYTLIRVVSSGLSVPGSEIRVPCISIRVIDFIYVPGLRVV